MAVKQRQNLSEGWRWRLAASNINQVAESIASIKDWNSVRAFPSVIQMELFASNIIPDFNVGENERLVQWVGEADWEYSTSFLTPEDVDKKPYLDLVFEGLDTFATVRLNDQEILISDNMFLPRRVDVKDVLRPTGQRNELSIVFESVYRKGDELNAKFGAKASLMRGDRRMQIRKAQYHWGWDWGPIIVTAGPYLPVYLESYTARVENTHISTDLAADHSSADVFITIQAAGAAANAATVQLHEKNGHQVANFKVTLDSSKKGSMNVSLSAPHLWWPNGQGAQHLYSAELALLDSSSNVLDRKTERFGVRTIKIIQRPLENAKGKTFLFNVNGRDIFSQGGNWIPADNLLPTISRERYFEWIRLAKFNHLNMIRVWGGGIYETDDFFEACDEYGMLVWHDYAFACGEYAVHKEFLDNVRAEAEAQTIRMRNRASLALLCGGNEDFMLCDLVNVKYDFHDHQGPFENSKFPWREIYLKLLPDVTARLAPNIGYWANSPWGAEGKNANDLNFGDVHQWNVWHGEQKPYQKYKDLSGRFVSEFGMHGFPIMRTVDVFAPNPKDRHPQSKAIDCHNKGAGAETRIARYLAENFRYDLRLENFVYCSQLLQSEAYGYSLRDWKRKFNGRGNEECAGAIIWQLNDVYPVTSWAYVDYYLRPKPAFYTIRRSFAPISVGIERTPGTRFIDEDHTEDSKIPKFDIFAHNTTSVDVAATLLLKAYDFNAGIWSSLEQPEKEVRLRAGYNTELGELKSHPSWTEDSLIILSATLLDKSTNKILARYVNWPEPYRYLHWPEDTKVNVSTEALGKDAAIAEGEVVFEDKVTIVANQAVKGAWLEPVYDGTETEEEPEPLWSDNMIDLLPGEEITVFVKGLRGRPVKVRFLSDWEIGALKPRL